MDGVLFFWFVWIIWVYVVFLMHKSAIRTQLSFCLLFIVIGSNYQINIEGIEVSYAFVIILLYGYYIIGKLSFQDFIYMIFGCGAISIAYACFYMLAIFDPVWVILDMKWMIALVMVIFTFLFFHKTKSRLVSLAVGLCHGEILYTFVILKLYPTKTIGNFYFLDVIASSIFICSTWYLLEYMTQKMQLHMQKSIQEKKQVYRP
jgi:hypothetical protein